MWKLYDRQQQIWVEQALQSLHKPFPTPLTFGEILGSFFPATGTLHDSPPMEFWTKRPYPSLLEGNRVGKMGAAGAGATQKYTFLGAAVPQREFQCTSTMRGLTTLHAFDTVHHRGGGTLPWKFASQQLAVHPHYIALPIFRHIRGYNDDGATPASTYRKAKGEKSSMATFSEVIFRSMSSNASLQRVLIPSYV